MHVGLIIYGSLDTVSGGYLYDRKMVRYLRDQGHTVEIISLPWRSYAAHLADNFSTRLLNRLKNSAFDLLLQDELNHPSLAWLNGRLRSQIAAPIISIVHHLRLSEQHSPLWQPLYRAVETRYLNSVDGFVFNSQTTRRVVQSIVGDKRPFVVALPAGDRFQALPKEPKSPKATHLPLKLLFVGNICRRKGVDTLIEAVAPLPKSDWTLDVVGCAMLEPRYAHKWLKEKPNAYGIQKNITFHNEVTDNQLAVLYEQCDVLVVPSQYEGFGIVYLEGMRFGCPAIGTLSGAAHEIITDGEDGFLIEVGDTAVLTRHLLTLINNPAQLQKMSHAAQTHFCQHPTWQESMATVERFLAGF